MPRSLTALAALLLFACQSAHVTSTPNLGEADAADTDGDATVEGDSEVPDVAPDTDDVGEPDAADAADIDVSADTTDVSDTAPDPDTEASDTDIDSDPLLDVADASDTDPADVADTEVDVSDTGIADTGAEDTGAADTGAPDTADVATDPGPEPDPPYPDVPLGPYTSLLEIFVDSALSNASSYDASTTYTHVAAQGAVLQAIAEVLWDARGFALEERGALLDAAIGEIAELEVASDHLRSLTGCGGATAPAYGLAEAWDAFGDGSTNSLCTAYTWQSGMAALGVAMVGEVLEDAGDPRAADVLAFGRELVEVWDAHYVSVTEGGYYPYSDQPSDAIAVHNTSVLVAMARQRLLNAGVSFPNTGRSEACLDLLWARMSGNPTTGYDWHYADDGYPTALRRSEDISHASVTLRAMHYGYTQGWWSRTQMRGVAQTLLAHIWTGDPSLLAGSVDGDTSADEDRRRTWSAAAGVAYAIHGDAEGNPAVWEYGRSVFFSTYLARHARPFEGARVDGTRTLLTALLLAHRPATFDADAWGEVVAGDGDTTAPEGGIGAHFYHADWAEPAGRTFADLRLTARRATAVNANVLVDVPTGTSGPVYVSVTYGATDGGAVQQWDGDAYTTIAPLPATPHPDGGTMWYRTTFAVETTGAHDYAGAPGTNILLQFTSLPTVHRVEVSAF